ncbi:MAG: hypothetical protein KatS3mg053_0879 [Candidatus Roseilinea sp.]|nr:MAG: hypothetical protein KatS3mg053_0879 [Candidatus Roseilinea sp.]
MLNALHPIRLFIGLALISASVLALQVIFTRIFSVMIWHHFTYLIVGIALLGGGASGVFLAMHRWRSEELTRRLGSLSLAFGMSVLITLLVITRFHFDPLRMSHLYSTILGLALYFACLFTVFLLGGMVIASAFSAWPHLSHRLYFADLLGASIATLSITWVVQAVGGPSALIVISLLATCAAGLFIVDRANWYKTVPVVAAAQLGILLLSLLRPVQLPIPESKSLYHALALSNTTTPEYTRWNPVARVDVTALAAVAEPMIVGGVSEVYLRRPDRVGEYSLRFVTLDGTSMTGLFKFDGDLSKFEFLRHAIIAAPYEIGPQSPRTLLIGIGGGIDILLAQQYGAREVVAIDVNSDVIDLVRNRYADLIGRLAASPNTYVFTAEGRSYLSRTDERFDIIQGIGLDNIAALNSGAYVLSESYLYTVEAFDLALNRLNEEGVFSWTRAVSEPPIETLRLTGLAAEALRRNGIDNPTNHIIVVENDRHSAINLLVARRAFTREQVERLKAWLDANQFRILHEPFQQLDTLYSQYLHASDPRAFEQAYAFNIYPVTDDHPFYYNYFKWDRLLERGAHRGDVSARIPIGNIILLAMFAFTLVTALLFVALPLWRNQRAGLRTPGAGGVLLYFSMLGIGYMFVQIVMIQRFTLFIGYPTLAITTVIFSMLLFSALGSIVAQKLVVSLTRLRLALVLVAFLIVSSAFLLPPIFEGLLGLEDTVRVLVSVILVAPLSFVMGMPFPTGLRAVGWRARQLVPWAWGMNGVFSVLGFTAVVLLSMATSFTVSLIGAALLYGLAAVAALALGRTSVEACMSR